MGYVFLNRFLKASKALAKSFTRDKFDLAPVQFLKISQLNTGIDEGSANLAHRDTLHGNASHSDWNLFRILFLEVSLDQLADCDALFFDVLLSLFLLVLGAISFKDKVDLSLRLLEGVGQEVDCFLENLLAIAFVDEH